MGTQHFMAIDLATFCWFLNSQCVIELDDGKIYRKPLYLMILMVKTHGFPVDFPLNQSIECVGQNNKTH